VTKNLPAVPPSSENVTELRSAIADLGEATRALRGVCHHGSLRRACETCDCDEQITALKAYNATLRAELDELEEWVADRVLMTPDEIDAIGAAVYWRDAPAGEIRKQFRKAFMGWFVSLGAGLLILLILCRVFP
jgi:hypothetical protein